MQEFRKNPPVTSDTTLKVAYELGFKGGAPCPYESGSVREAAFVAGRFNGAAHRNECREMGRAT